MSDSQYPADPLLAFRIALRNGDADTMRRIHAAEPDLFSRIRKRSGPIACDAAKSGTAAMMQVLIELGSDINEQDANGFTALCWAVTRSKMDIVQTLLRAGADPRLDCAIFRVAGDDVSEPIAFAQLLLDHGADINQPFEVEGLAPRTVLSQAIRIGNQELVDFLKARGATLPGAPANQKRPSAAKEPVTDDVNHDLLAHFAQCYGEPEKEVIREIVPTTSVPLAIHYIPAANNREGFSILFTAGLSAREFEVADGAGEKRRAELMVALDRTWPAPNKALTDPKLAWPIQWMRKIATGVIEGQISLGARFTLLRAEDDKSLGPKVPFSAWMLVALQTPEALVTSHSGDVIQIYQLFPLYSEEYDLARQQGTEKLMALFASREIQEYIDLSRPNVAATDGPSRKPRGKK